MRGVRDLFGDGYLSAGTEDLHVHTQACNDSDQSAEQALTDAIEHGIEVVCFTAHVRLDTPVQHVLSYLESIDEASEQFGQLTIRRSVETKLLDVAGNLDLPPELDLSVLDTVHIADHRFPLDSDAAPREVAAQLANGELTERAAWEALVESTCHALQQYPPAIVAHPLSIIPKIGLDQSDLPTDLADHWAHVMAKHESVMEINNKWDCPGLSLVRAAHAAGVPVVSASDAHHAGETGRQSYRDVVVAELGTG